MNIINLETNLKEIIISQAVSVLRSGGLLIYPTETVYGLGVDATNQEAVDKLLKFKGQRGLKPILIAVSDQKMAEDYVDLNDVARKLYRTFLPGPVAVVSRMKRSDPASQGQTLGNLAGGISSPDGTVGIRIPDYPLILKIIKAFGKPITSTSANISDTRNPWSIEDIKKTSPENKLELIDLMLDAGKLSKRPPSTIVDTSRERTEIVREGSFAGRLKAKGQGTREEKYISHSPIETARIAQRLMRRLTLPSALIPYPFSLILALQGPLGAGKTVFTKGIAQALGVTDLVRSPSYTLVNEYSIPSSLIPYLFESLGAEFSGRTPEDSQSRRPSSFLYHIDAWRLHDSSEFQDLGLGQMLKSGNIVVIEWIERLVPMLKKLQTNAKIVFVEIGVKSATERKIKITR